MENADGLCNILPFPAVSSHEGGSMQTTTDGWYKVPGSELTCRHFRDICRDALRWLHETEQLPEPNPFIIRHINFVDYILFRLWRVEYEVYGEKGKKIMQGYCDAFEIQCADLLEEFPDPRVQERWFIDWFINEGYHAQPPLLFQALLERVAERFCE